MYLFGYGYVWNLVPIAIIELAKVPVNSYQDGPIDKDVD